MTEGGNAENVREEEMLSVGGLAEMYGISARTLRHWHDIGLFISANINDMTGYRCLLPGEIKTI